MRRYYEFCKAVAIELRRSNLREGQVWYNTLQEMHPDIANKVVGTFRDPFYDDSILPDFHLFVYELMREA